MITTKECIMKICVGVYKGSLYEFLLQILNNLSDDRKSINKKRAIRNIESWEREIC